MKRKKEQIGRVTRKLAILRQILSNEDDYRDCDCEFVSCSYRKILLPLMCAYKSIDESGVSLDAITTFANRLDEIVQAILKRKREEAEELKREIEVVEEIARRMEEQKADRGNTGFSSN